MRHTIFLAAAILLFSFTAQARQAPEVVPAVQPPVPLQEAATAANPSPEMELANVPPPIVERATNYIVSVVGSDYYNRNYKLEKAQFIGSKDPSKQNEGTYILSYIYKPITAISPGQFMDVTVPSNPANATQGTVAFFVDGKIIEPDARVNRAYALDTAYKFLRTRWQDKAPMPTYESLVQEKNIDGKIEFVNENRARLDWSVLIHIPTGKPGCRIQYAINIDARTGLLTRQLANNGEMCGNIKPAAN